MPSLAFKRFYIITGKGGVGKTTLSLEFAKFIRSHGVKTTHITLSDTSFDRPKTTHHNQSVDINLSNISLNIEDCAETYIAKRLKSGIVAKWIVKTAFFRSLVNMIPGFGYVIFLGKILELLKDDPDLVVVLDAPASGHTLTMLEATKNFQEIFKVGIIFEDTKKMIEMLAEPNFTRINILTLPSLLSLSEASELKLKIKEIGQWETKVFINQTLTSFKDDLQNVPKSLSEKIQLEENLLQENTQQIDGNFSYLTNFEGSTLEQLSETFGFFK